VKPNSSELSYLLFYASSRRSKIHKVGQFLEKKTASDVWRLRIGNVQVTLQILAALIEKSPKDLPLFAPNVLKVLSLILRSQDLTMVEASLPTFETFCEHHDAAALFADQSYLEQYKEVTKVYAGFASTVNSPAKTTPSKPIAMRWRSAGLAAIKSIAMSDALSSVAGRQLDTTVPMVLENLWTDNEDFLQVLLQRANLEEKSDNIAPIRRRTSISTTQTSDAGGDTNPVALSGSTNDIDRLAEQDVGVLAMQCLKQIFVVPNRAQVSGATRALIDFINDRLKQNEVVVKPHPHTGQDKGWAIAIFSLVARWAPVQDRYIILITAMDVLAKTPMTNDNAGLHSTLVAIVGSLLQSDVNLIGLSVMDVLLGLLQFLKKVLRGRSYTKVNPGSVEDEKNGQVEATDTDNHELLQRIQKCIGHLATHVYYGDQVTDMISTILSLLRLHPTVADAGQSAEKVEGRGDAAESAGNLSDDQHQLDSLFAVEAAKVLALRAIKSILLVANSRTKADGRSTLNRSKVPLQVWDGTHWLLRDPDSAVRVAYADALVTWLDRETTRRDASANDGVKPRVGRVSRRESPFGQSTRRAVSSASNRERPARFAKSHFLRLLHLAAYDNALQFMDHESDIVLLHIVLAKLVDRLGINAVRFGLPMIFRLQEDIQEADTPLQKVRLGCLCHGYFLAVSTKFQLEGSIIGRAIQAEVSRRRSKQFWVEGIQVPSPTVETAFKNQKPEFTLPSQSVESEALLPFDERFPLIEQLCGQYQERSQSPSLSPPSSPGRAMAQPVLGSTSLTIPSATPNDRELPNYMRDDMLTEWSREVTLAAVQEGSKSASLSGSKTGTGSRFGGSGLHPNGYAGSRPPSAYAQNSIRPLSHVGASHMAALRKNSLPSRGSTRSQSPRGQVASVDQLKSVLSGEAVRPSSYNVVSSEEDDSDSMASHDFAPSEFSVGETEAARANGEGGLTRSRSKSSLRKSNGDDGGPLSANPAHQELDDLDEVPPVPPLPSGVTGVVPAPQTANTSQTVSPQQNRPKTGRRSLKSRSGEGNSGFPGAFDSESGGAMDLQSLLKGIDSKSREHTMGSLSKPPY